MNDALLLTAIAAGTALATGLGALPVIALGGERARSAQGVLSGLAAGVMAVAAIVGLLRPAAGVLFAHSLPEGLAIGAAFASSQAGLGAFVIAAIAIQNVPEGTATAAAMQPAGYGAAKQFWGAVLTSVPQVPGALFAWLAVKQVDALLSASFALAGAAMLALVVVDLLPDAWGHASHRGVAAGTAIGAALMLAVGAALQV
jgi:ZIP family zinc transporter